MKTYSEYTIRISSDPSYYGSHCTQQEADIVVEELENLVRVEFPGIQTSEGTDGQGSSKTTGPDDAVADEVDLWVQDNWVRAVAAALQSMPS